VPTAIIVHGGAGPLPDPAESAPEQARYLEGCLAAARLGHRVLARGGSALDAVVEAVAALEDDPLFNAGTGSCLNEDGEVEMDAAVMDGEGLRAGAVGAVRGLRSPVRLARAVMERTAHLLLVAEGAQRLAREVGAEQRSAADLITPRALAKWRSGRPSAQGGGTVGAAALDGRGGVAAATSTGGIGGKRAGRVGDTPVVGAGTFADLRGGAASATGHGESILRVGLTRAVCEALRHGRLPEEAAELGMAELQRIGGQGGVVLVDRQGRLGQAFNTARMSRAWVDVDGNEGGGFGR
jgi:L-asparaginase / beta-aspartyl-peptidase